MVRILFRKGDKMGDADNGTSYAAAITRLDAALSRLDTGLRGLNSRVRTVARVEAENQRLAADRSRLAGELDRATAQARKLDEAAAMTSRQLVEAMETVKSVLTSSEGV